MSEEDNKSTNTPSFDQQVNDVVGKMVKNEEKGTWELPAEVLEETTPEVAYAAKLEKRYRDTQSAYTKATQKAKELETVNSKLESHLVDSATNHLSKEQREELDELKLRDPDAWREKLNEHEQEARRLLQEKIDGYRQEGKQMSEKEKRQIQLADFTERTGIKLNDQIIEEQLPAAYSKQLEKGEITFDDFLSKAQKFLTSDKVIDGTADDDSEKNKSKTTNLSNLPGGSRPSSRAQEADIVESYKNEVY